MAIGAFSPEYEHKSRVAYEAWVTACGRTGVNVPNRWEDLLDDEKYQWGDVYNACVEDKAG